MKKNQLVVRAHGLRFSAVILMQAAALALVAILALPAHASDRAVKSRIAPTYPEVAKRMKIAGVVKVEANVDADGKVTNVKTLTGNRMLSTAAEEAVHRWKFVPAATPSTETVDVNFSLGQ
jgi:TonB family protein